MQNTQSKMARGAAWMILFKWVERGLGFISTLILVRLLSPEDFGLVAMAMSFIAMAELMSAFAFDIALIHDQSAGPAHYHSAWTANVILGASIATIMVAVAYPISLFYNEPGLVVLVCVLALGPLATGLENIGVVAFRKELEFHKEFTFQVARKLISFSVAIPLAFILQSYWALVFGILASKFGGTVLSYWVHPFRPKFSFEKIRELLRFSRWLLINNMVNFLKERSTDFFVGRIQGASSLGVYNVTYEFANLPTFELGAPVNRALLPGFAKLNNDMDGVRSSFKAAIGLVALIAIPAALGLFAIAPFMVPVVLGEKWLAGVPVMEILSINSAILVFHGTIVTLFIAIGRPQSATRTNVFFVIILMVGLSLLTGEYGIEGAAYSMLTACVLSTPIFLLQLRRFIALGLLQFFGAILRPVLAAAIMVYAVRWIMPEYTLGMPVSEGIQVLVQAVSLGALVYTVSIFSLWILSGKRQGAESLVLSKVMLRYDALTAKLKARKSEG